MCECSHMGFTKLDPAKLPAKKEGWTKAELAARYKTSVNVIAVWFSRLRKTKHYTVERVRTPDRYIVRRAKKK